MSRWNCINSCDVLSDLDSARKEIERLRRENLTFRAAQKACEDCGVDDPVWVSAKQASLEGEIIALRKDLDDALEALRNLRHRQNFPFVGGDLWLAAVDEADAVLDRFDIKTTE